MYRTEKYKRLKAEVEKQSKKRKWLVCEPHATVLFALIVFLWTVNVNVSSVACLILVEKKKETITESAGRQQKKKIGKTPVNKFGWVMRWSVETTNIENLDTLRCSHEQPFSSQRSLLTGLCFWMYYRKTRGETEEQQQRLVYGERQFVWIFKLISVNRLSYDLISCLHFHIIDIQKNSDIWCVSVVKCKLITYLHF